MSLFGRERIRPRTPDQIRAMRVAGLLTGRTLEMLRGEVRAGDGGAAAQLDAVRQLLPGDRRALGGRHAAQQLLGQRRTLIGVVHVRGEHEDGAGSPGVDVGAGGGVVGDLCGIGHADGARVEGRQDGGRVRGAEGAELGGCGAGHVGRIAPTGAGE